MYFKALTTDRKSFYDGKTEWEIGKPMPEILSEVKGPCGPGYHLGKTLNDAITFAKWPMSLYEAEPCGALLGEDGQKARFTSAKLVKEIEKPSWVKRTEKFIDSIKSVKWLDGHGKTRKAWRMFDSRAAAWVAAWAAAGDAAGDAAWVAAGDAAWVAAGDAERAAARAAAGDAAGDAAWVAAGDAERAAARAAAGDARLLAYMEICSDLKIDRKHSKHAADRWEVWERGYGVVCDVSGVLYCYRKA